MSNVEHYQFILSKMKQDDPNRAFMEHYLQKEIAKRSKQKRLQKSQEIDFTFLDQAVQQNEANERNEPFVKKDKTNCKKCNLDEPQEVVEPTLDLDKLPEIEKVEKPKKRKKKE